MILERRTVDVAQPGRSIGRDIATGEKVEAELDAFVSRRHEQRVATEGERQAEESWKASERAYFVHRRQENRLAWCDYFSHLAGALRARAEEYDRRAALLEDRGRGVRS
jgi:hypothetical protein